MTLYEVILAAINGPCTASATANRDAVNPEAWAGLIEQAVKEWVGATTIEAPLVAVLVERALFPAVGFRS